MQYRGIDIVCPLCKADLQEEQGDERRLCCVSCGRQFPIVLGIPDLRLRPDPYIDMAGDRAKGVELAERLGERDFAGAVDLYYELAAKVPLSQAQQFKQGLMAAVSRAEEALDRWEGESDSCSRGARLLDVGCGTAPMLVVAARRYKQVVGIDIAFRWLVIAQRRLEEEGLTVPLLCAGAEALPFPDGAFDRVVADAVFEHVWDQRATMAECYRVLRRAGHLGVATPNRFSLGPDPHVGLWAGGWLPKDWIDAYVRRQGGNPPHRHLLSYWGLQHLCREAGFRVSHIYLPDIAAGQRSQCSAVMKGCIDMYHMAKRLPLSQQLLHVLGPLLHAVAQKPDLGVENTSAAPR